jgi:hypothetical protein
VGGVLLLLRFRIYCVVTDGGDDSEIAVRWYKRPRRRVMGWSCSTSSNWSCLACSWGFIAVAFVVQLRTGVPLSNLEPLAYVTGCTFAVLIAILASLAPARRAASVQPMIAMRSE